MVNENMVKSGMKYNIVYVFKSTALKFYVKSRKYTRYSQWQYGDSVRDWFRVLVFSENMLNTSIHNYYY